MKPWLQKSVAPRSTRRLPLGSEQLLIAAILLLIAWGWSVHILNAGSGFTNVLSSELVDFWVNTEVVVKTGLFWLVGGIMGLLYLPVFLVSVLASIINRH